MKACPSCAFINEESEPLCVLCHAQLVDVPSTPASDPSNPEHERRRLAAMRDRIIRRQLGLSATGYGVAVTGLALFPGLITSPWMLLLYLLSAGVVVFAVLRDLAGQFSAAFLQGALSLALLMYFGPLQPMVFFMLAGHLVLPALFWHAKEAVYTDHR